MSDALERLQMHAAAQLGPVIVTRAMNTKSIIGIALDSEDAAGKELDEIVHRSTPPGQIREPQPRYRFYVFEFTQDFYGKLKRFQPEILYAAWMHDLIPGEYPLIVVAEGDVALYVPNAHKTPTASVFSAN